jgi:DNA-binding NtrC family response regulator
MSLPWWVLVVDDDAEVNALIVEMLRDEGFTAHGLTQARAAMALLESASPPGFIIADMTMPDIDGIDLIGRAERHGIKGMLITAADPRQLKGELSGRTMPVMRKPFEVDELIRLVAHYRPTPAPACAADKSGPITCSV